MIANLQAIFFIDARFFSPTLAVTIGRWAGGVLSFLVSGAAGFFGLAGVIHYFRWM
jgi:hypothetical protein